MDRVYGANTVQTEPTFSADAPSGFPTDGSSGGGVPATVPKAAWYNAITEELVNAIKGGGITPERNTLTQLNESIDARIVPVRELIEAVKAALNARIDALETTPTGLIAYFMTTEAPSAYWLVCDGRAVSRTAYAKLFEKIGTTCGPGNGSTTFNLPDMRNRVPWGATNSIGTAIQPGLPNITGKFSAYEFTAFRDSSVRGEGALYPTGEAWFGGNKGSSDQSAVLGLDASRSNAIYGRSSTVQPPALTLLPCIHI